MNFEEFYQTLMAYPSLKSVFSIYDIVINFLLPVILLIPISLVYKKTHRGVSYNQMFTHTIFVMSVTTSIIMMIIGSNIARAFSLVGALSIIRFRTAIKDSRDTGYIFSAISIGMATGTGMYIVAVVYTILFCGLMLGLNYYRFGEKLMSDKLLKVNLKGKDTEATENKIDDYIKEHTLSSSLIHSELLGDGDGMQYTFIINTQGTESDKLLMKKLKNNEFVERATIFYNDQRIEI